MKKKLKKIFKRKKRLNKNILIYFARVCFSASFLYIGIDSLANPDSWIGFVPNFIEDLGISKELFLKISGSFDIFLSFWIISGFRAVYATSVVGVVVVFKTMV